HRAIAAAQDQPVRLGEECHANGWDAARFHDLARGNVDELDVVDVGIAGAYRRADACQRGAVGREGEVDLGAIFEPETRLRIAGQPLLPLQPKLAGVGRLARLDPELASLRPCRELPPEGPEAVVQSRGQARNPVAAVAQVLRRFSLLPGEPRIRAWEKAVGADLRVV